jgi:hypothetical protein
MNGGRPFEHGEAHPDAKLNGRIVSRLRRIAARRRLPRGWMDVERRLLAKKGIRVSRAAITLAIGGKTWAHLTTPPVPTWKRWRGGDRRRWK